MRTFGVKRAPAYSPKPTYLRDTVHGEVNNTPADAQFDFGMEAIMGDYTDEPYDLTDKFKGNSRIGEVETPSMAIADSKLNVPAIERGPTDPLKEFEGTGLGMYLTKKDEEFKKMQNKTAGIKTASALITAAGGVINAQSKYNQSTNQNNYNIELANNQIKEVMSDAARLKLRTQTKGVEAGNDALLAAIAQGQSVQGDMANKAVANELMFAAQNMMNIEINSIRSVFNIESQINSLNSASNVAGINRDLERNQAIFEGIMGVTAANIHRMPNDVESKP